MLKEEIFAVLDQLTIDQERFNKFTDYLVTFTSEPRCKKGCIEFVGEIFNLPQVDGKDVLAMQLVSVKTSRNAFDTRWFIENHPITQGYLLALKQARLQLMNKVAEYIIELSGELDKSSLSDKDERQVYLRRAVARLKTIFYSNLKVAIEENQWHEVEPYEYMDYLNDDLASLVKYICSEEEIVKWSDVYGDTYHLNKDATLTSIRSFVNYLDTFLEF